MAVAPPHTNTAHHAIMPSSHRSWRQQQLLLVNDEVPSVPPCKAHDLVGSEVTAAIGHWREEPEDVEDGRHPQPHTSQVRPGQARGTEVISEEVVPVLHHGRQQTHL